MYRKFLVPTDGSSYSDAAGAYAVYFAEKFGKGHVVGLHVIDIKTLAGPFLHDLGVSIGLGPFDTFQPKVRKVLEEKGREALRRLEERCKDAFIDCETDLVEGIVVREIVSRAATCDMVVMGRLGEHASWRSAPLGHHADAVARSSSHPVLLVPETYKAPCLALLAYDGSPQSYNAMHAAGEIASTLALPLVVVSADADKEKALQLVKDAERYLRRFDLDVECVTSSEPAELAIVNTAADHSCDIVIMGAYGHSRIREFIIGSTTAEVIHQVETAILLHR